MFAFACAVGGTGMAVSGGKGERHTLRELLCVSGSHGGSCRKLSKALTVTIVLFLVEGN